MTTTHKLVRTRKRGGVADKYLHAWGFGKENVDRGHPLIVEESIALGKSPDQGIHTSRWRVRKYGALHVKPTIHRHGISAAYINAIATGITSADWCLHDIGEIMSSQPGEELLKEQFSRLTKQWHTETDGHSSPSRIVSNQAYLKIISLGKSVIPMILDELREKGGYWYPALRALTDENPVPESARGRTRLMKEAWLDWGNATRI